MSGAAEVETVYMAVKIKSGKCRSPAYDKGVYRIQQKCPPSKVKFMQLLYSWLSMLILV